MLSVKCVCAICVAEEMRQIIFHITLAREESELTVEYTEMR